MPRKMRGLYLLLLFSNFFRCSIAELTEPHARDSLTFPVQEAELKDSVTISLFSLTWLAVSASLVALLLSLVQSNAVVKVKQLFSNFQFQRLAAEFIIYALSEKESSLNLSSMEAESDVDAGICNSDAHQQSESKSNNSPHDSLTELDDGYIKSRREANQAKPIKMKKIVLFADHNPQQAGNEGLANLSDRQTSLKPNIGKLCGFSLHQPLEKYCPLEEEEEAEEILNTKDYPGVSWSQIEGRAAVHPICSPMDGKDTGLPPKSILCLPLPKVGAIRLGRHGRSVLEVDWVVPPPKRKSSFTRHQLLNW